MRGYETGYLIDGLFGNLFPVDALKETVRFQLFISILAVAKSLLILFYQQLFNQTLQFLFFFIDLISLINFNFIVQNLSPYHSLTFVKKWRSLVQHFIKNAPQGP